MVEEHLYVRDWIFHSRCSCPLVIHELFVNNLLISLPLLHPVFCFSFPFSYKDLSLRPDLKGIDHGGANYYTEFRSTDVEGLNTFSLLIHVERPENTPNLFVHVL